MYIYIYIYILVRRCVVRVVRVIKVGRVIIKMNIT